jgi:hypothetical protein
VSFQSVSGNCATPGGVAVLGEDLGEPALSNGTCQSPLDTRSGLIGHGWERLADLTGPTVLVGVLACDQGGHECFVVHVTILISSTRTNSILVPQCGHLPPRPTAMIHSRAGHSQEPIQVGIFSSGGIET